MKKADKKIYLSPPCVNPNTFSYVQNALASGWIAPYGPYLDLFEQKIKEHTGTSHCLTVSSGTAALHLALRALEVKEDDTVYCSVFSFIASANPILYVGAKPVFIDSEYDTWNMCPHALERAFSDNLHKNRLPKAVIVVHTYGMPAKMDQIMALCQHYKVPIIEDSAEALGSYFDEKALGTLGDIGIFSFNGNKIVTASSGGAIVTNNSEYDKKMLHLAGQAKDHMPHYYHTDLGYNYKMSNICAAIGAAQIEDLRQKVKRKRDVFEQYRKEIKNKRIKICFQEEIDKRFFSNRWLTCIFSPEEKNSFIKLREVLKKKHIETRSLWYPLHLQPVFKRAPCYQKETSNVSEVLFQGGLCLPSGNNLRIEEQQTIIALVKEYSFLKG